jgi:hypothetical protein
VDEEVQALEAEIGCGGSPEFGSAATISPEERGEQEATVTGMIIFE